MTSTLMNYTTRAGVESFLNRTFPEISDAQFNTYLLAGEAIIHKYLAYDNETTTSGILLEAVVREKQLGKIDNFGNLVVDLGKPPVQFDVNGNPRVSLVEYNFGGIHVPLQLTDGSNNALNTLLSVSENRRKVVYPSIYFLPYLPTVTPTAKTNLFNLQDTKFWVDISYYGGFPVCPADIAQAANLITANIVLVRDNPLFAQSVRQGSYSIDYFARSNAGGISGRSENRMMIAAQELLDPYVRYTW